MCSREVTEDELSHFLDYLSDFASDEKILGLYKKVCRRYLYVYPQCVKFYIKVYQEMWEDENPTVKGNMRDVITLNQLLVLVNLERYNAVLINRRKNQKERMELLWQLAVQQLQTLDTVTLNNLPKLGMDS